MNEPRYIGRTGRKTHEMAHRTGADENDRSPDPRHGLERKMKSSSTHKDKQDSQRKKKRNHPVGERHPTEATSNLEVILEKEREKLKTYPVRTYTREYIKAAYQERGFELNEKEIIDALEGHRNAVELPNKFGYIVTAHLIIEQGLKTAFRTESTSDEEKLATEHRLHIILEALNKKGPEYRHIMNAHHRSYIERHQLAEGAINCGLSSWFKYKAKQYIAMGLWDKHGNPIC